MKLKLITLLTMSITPFVLGNSMESYKKASVQPVVVDRSNDQLTITYTEPATSTSYSSGADYTVEGDIIKVRIERCYYNKKCDSKAPATPSADKAARLQVSIPYQGEKVIMVYTDTEEQIYP